MNQRYNESSVTEFILLGFSALGNNPILLVLMLSFVYATILVFNIIIMSVILLDQTLHSPMYFLLFAFSNSETCMTFITIPRLLMALSTGTHFISFAGCAVQMFCYFSFAANNCFLLIAMAYDRYVAICYPLQYWVLMDKAFCIKLLTTSCAAGCLISLSTDVAIFRLPFCGSNEIQHFFCDLFPVLNLACTDIYQTNIEIILLCATVLLGTVILILVSYICILSAVLKIRSNLGRQKAFSTCASHLTLVTIHFGFACFMYLRPKSASSLESDTWISLVFVFLIPLLNPIIYTLRNKDVKQAIVRLLRKVFCSQKLRRKQ